MLRQVFIALFCFLHIYTIGQRPVFDAIPDLTGHVYAIGQDRDGYLWIGSREGVGRYDGHYWENIDSDHPHLGLSHDYVQTIMQSSDGSMWLGTRKGLNVLSPDLKSVKQFTDQKGELSHYEIRRVIEDPADGKFWIATYGGGVNLYDPKFEGFDYFMFDSLDQTSISGDKVNDILLDTDGDLWVAAEAGGLSYKRRSESSFSRYSISSNRERYTVSALAETEKTIWVGSWSKGLYLVEEGSDILVSVLRYPGDDNPRNTIRRILANKDGTLWLATLGGLCHYDPDSKEALWYEYQKGAPGTLSGNALWSIFKDREGILWIGMLSKGLCKWDPHAHMVRPVSAKKPERGPGRDGIYSLFKSNAKNELWMSTREGGISILDLDSNKFISTTFLDALDGHSVSSIIEDKLSNIWFTSDHGVFRYRLATQEVDTFSRSYFATPGIEVGGIYSCEIGPGGDLYLGGWGTGLVVLRSEYLKNEKILPTDFDQYLESNSPLNDDVVWQVLSGKDNQLYVNTKAGVYVVDDITKEIKPMDGPLMSLRFSRNSKGEVIGLNSKTGLYSLDGTKKPEMIFESSRLGIRIEKHLTDAVGNHWISSERGITVLDPMGNDIIGQFDTHVGVPKGSGFFEHVVLSDSLIYLGTSEGLYQVNPKELFHTYKGPAVRIKAVSVRDSIVALSGFMDKMTFAHDQNAIGFEFSPMSLSESMNVSIRYKLNKESHWHETTRERARAYYSNLAPGDYELHVQWGAFANHWGEPRVLAKFEILPPWYATWWFKTLVAILIVGIVWIIVRSRIVAIRLKNEVELQRLQKTKEKELQDAKLTFFTNISHDIKTPLTLILASVQQLKKSTEAENLDRLTLVERNAAHLSDLVDELLDFRRLEQDVVEFYLETIDLNYIVNEVMIGFEHAARLRGGELLFIPDEQQCMVDLDVRQFRKVITNLLANAFEHVNEEGTVKCVISQNAGNATLSVFNTGSQLTEAEEVDIFKRFVSSEEKEGNSGLGLTIAKEVVERHSGSIKVTSSDDGVTFDIVLELAKTETLAASNGGQNNASDNPVILIVEDNPDVRSLLTETLSEEYTVVSAIDGEDGYSKASELDPALIISDVMMPRLSGVDMTDRLKSNLETSHIPIILLSAKTTINDQKEGLKAKADDYLTKPYEASIVMLKTRNLIDRRQQWIKQFRLANETKVDTSQLTSIDEKLYLDMLTYVSDHMQDSDFNVESMSRHLGLSRSHLSRKIKSYSGYSPVEFISHMRLKKARTLLESHKMTVSDVAYEVGYSNPRYFSTAFKAAFGKTPTDVAKNAKD